MTTHRFLRYCELLFVLVIVALVAQVIRAGLGYGFDPSRIMVIVFLLAVAWGLAMSHVLARRFTAVLCLLFAFIIPFGMLSPFYAGDLMAAGIPPPTITEMLVWMIPLECFLLGSAYVLDLRLAPQPPTPGSRPEAATDGTSVTAAKAGRTAVDC